MANNSIRRAQPNEGSDLTELAIRSKSFWPYSADYIKKCRTPLTVDAAYVRRWPTYVLEDENQLLGFYSFFENNDRRWLDNLWLEPSAIGSGMGKCLFEHAVKTAQELNWVPFYIAGDAFALKFYLKMGCQHVGFEKSQVLENFYLPLLLYK